MAITKTSLGITAESSFTRLYNYLTAEAVPTYFSSITKQQDNSYLSCFIGELEFLRIYADQSSNGNGILVTTASGATKTVKGYYSTTTYFSYAYKCTNGIMLTRYANNGQKDVSLTISKDNNGDTVCVFCTNNLGDTVSDLIAQYCAISKTDVAPLGTPMFGRKTDYNATVLVPFVTNCALNTLRYTPNTFWFPFTQYTSIGTITIDGVNYLSNGYWCIKD